MNKLFKFFRNIFMLIILLILVYSFGYADWRTWVIYILGYIAMLCDYLSEKY